MHNSARVNCRDLAPANQCGQFARRVRAIDLQKKNDVPVTKDGVLP